MAGDGEEEAEPEEEEEEEEDERDWEEELMAAVTSTPPSNLIGLPQGLRIRAAPAKTSPSEAQKEEGGLVGAARLVAAAGLRPGSRREVWALGVFCAISVLLTGRFFYQWLLPVSPAVENWRRGCRQCRHEWWDDFWHWRLKGISEKGASSSASGLPHDPPEGMEWEWGDSVNDTDWYGASPELVNSVIKVFADPALGPVLQIGCGDSPLPELLHKAGFHTSEHLDVSPEVITAVRSRHPIKEWPGMQFKVRDFLSSGAPAPAHRFGAVIDKAGIWDWLQEEASHALPRLLSNVRRALVEGSEQQGVYIIATKQTPSELSKSLSAAAAGGRGGGFLVEATHPLGTKGIAWAYVLIPI